MYPAEKELDPHYSALSTRSNRPPLLRLLDTRGNRDSMKLRLESRKSLCIQQKKKWAPITLGPGCARTREASEGFRSNNERCKNRTESLRRLPLQWRRMHELDEKPAKASPPVTTNA